MISCNRLFKEVDLANLLIASEDPVKYYDASLLGQICINRLGGLAYFRMSRGDKGLDGIVPSEYTKVLSSLYRSNIKRTEKYLDHLEYVAGLFTGAQFKHAFLKGAFLTTKLYPKGLRTSNDIDILIMQKDISACQKILIDNGFIQGQENDGKIIPATRAEIINSRMNYGETIPFFKTHNDSIISIDINFSLDYKPAEDAVLITKMLDSTTSIQLTESTSFNTLNTVHFLIHLCCHLYKEATTYDWVILRRDLTLYKFVDISVFLDAFNSEAYFMSLADSIHELHLERECFYTFENSAVIFPRLRDMPGFAAMMANIRPSDLGFMRQIMKPKEGEIFEHSMGFEEWFFCEDREAAMKKA